MNTCPIILAGTRLSALGSGALFWPDQGTLVVSDLHLGKSGRRARQGAALLPPYEVRDSLGRIEAELLATGAATVICLGDSFDDAGAAQALPGAELDWLSRLQAGRRWIWIEGNHDGPAAGPGGVHLSSLRLENLIFRHIAEPGPAAPGTAEISGHYHPKARLTLRGASLSRPCFLLDEQRLILPAFGTYTGGLDWRDPALSALLSPRAEAILTGQPPVRLAIPTGRSPRRASS